MVHLINGYNLKRIIISSVLGAFILTQLSPIQAQAINLNVKDASFIYRIEKLVQKIWKLEKSKDKSKIYEATIELKQEIETACDIKLDISKCMANVEKELKKQGHQLPKKQFDAIKKALKEKDKKHGHHIKYLAATAYFESYEFNYADECAMFSEILAKHKKESKDDEEQASIPVQLVFGITMTLCGVFLMAVPFPACKPWGERMIASGIVICGNCISGKVDDDRKKENNQKKE